MPRFFRRVLLTVALLPAASCSDRSLPDRPQQEAVHEAIVASAWPDQALVGIRSVTVSARSSITGDVVVEQAITGRASVALRASAVVNGSVTADRIRLGRGAEIVGDARYNSLVGPGTVSGSRATPLPLPVDVSVPSAPSAAPGGQDIVVLAGQDRTLSAGSYGSVRVGVSLPNHATTLTLSGGLYAFDDLTLLPGGHVECSSTCQVVVSGSLRAGLKASIGTEDGTPRNLDIFVVGKGPAVALEPGGAMTARLSAPGRAISLGANCDTRGTIVADTILVGEGATLKKGTIPQTVAVIDAPTAATAVGDAATLTFEARGAGGRPVPGAALEVSATSMPWESAGVALTDPSHLVTTVMYNPDSAAHALVLHADNSGRATVSVQAAASGLYTFGVHATGTSGTADVTPYVTFTGDAPQWLNWQEDFSPAARQDPIMVYDPSRTRAVVFGGVQVPPGTPTPEGYTDTWFLSVPPDPDMALARSWHPIVAPGTPPSGNGACGVYVPDRDMLFVASPNPSTDLIEFWALSFGAGAFSDSGTWTHLAPDTTGVAPSFLQGKTFSRATYDVNAHKMLVYGGRRISDNVTSNDLLVLDLSGGGDGVLTAESAPMPPREEFGFFYDSLHQRSILYGGTRADSPGVGSILTDAWTIQFAGSGSTPTVAPIDFDIPTGSAVPTPRAYFSLANDPSRHRAIMYGGLTSIFAFSKEVWEIGYSAADKLTWTKDSVRTYLGEPSARGRYGVGATFTDQTGRMIVFGGIDDSGSPLDDTWELQWEYRQTLGIGALKLPVAVQFFPTAVYNDGIDQSRIEVHFDPTDVPAQANMLVPLNVAVSGEAPGTESVQLFDDGTHGDRVASDGIFSRGGITYAGPVQGALPPAVPGSLAPQPLAFTVQSSSTPSGNNVQGTYYLGALAAPENVATTLVQGGAGVPEIRKSAHAYFVVDSTNALCSDYVFQKKIVSGGTLETCMSHVLSAVANAVPEFTSTFELSVIMPARPTFDGAAYTVSENMRIHPAASKIGLGGDASSACCNGSTPCGACDDLLSVAWVNAPNDPDYGMAHEIGHTWITEWDRYSNPGNLDGISQQTGSHWLNAPAQPNSAVINSVMGVNNPSCISAADTASMTFTYGYCGLFSDYDLYLMGVVPSSSLSDIVVLQNASLVGYSFTSTKARAISSILAENGGERSPAAGAAPTDFDLAFVVVSQEPFTPGEVAYFDRYARWAASSELPHPPATKGEPPFVPFSTATGDKVTLHADVP